MIEQIKEVLASRTQGEWVIGVCTPSTSKVQVGTSHYMVTLPNELTAIAFTGPYGNKESENDAMFIANAPTYIRYLLDELEKAHKDIERLKAIDERESYITIAIRDESIKLKTEYTAMKKALERINGTTMSMFISLEDMLRYIKEISSSTLSQPR